jgi:nitrogen fixation NifU-like protein
MFDSLGDLYQQVILDHSKSPRNFRVLPDATSSARGQNPLCGDQVQVFVRMEGDRIADVGFQGSGCPISKASASMMTTILKGKTRGEAKQLFDRFHATVTTGEPQANEKLSAFAGVHKFPARVKCAILPWHAVVAALDGKSDPVTTESENS